ncbi:MAG: hypothetical protein ACRDOO_02210 [Actinomadura sp.]
MRPFDEQCPPGERFPRRLRAEFTAEPGPYGQVVHLTVNGVKAGDPLTDRGWSESGYRWHDALHLAHAVCLGWSPVLRSLTGLRRRSDPQTDHIEDGGRALVADEAIAWASFCYARAHRWLPYGPPAALIDRVVEMTYGLEVARCTRLQWRITLVAGLDAMRALWNHQGGTLLGDLDTATLKFQAPAAAAS